jgi:hypothetical protein
MTTMANAVRRVLREAGFTEDRGYSRWGYKVIPGTVEGVVRIEHVRDHDRTTKESSVRFGNEQISQYVRTLQSAGYRVSRVNGVTSIDSLLVLKKDQ